MLEDCKSELRLCGFLSALSFGASFEELANVLIDQIDVNVETTPRTVIALSSYSSKDTPPALRSAPPLTGKAADYFDVSEARLTVELP
jgi:hypothetical protein